MRTITDIGHIKNVKSQEGFITIAIGLEQHKEFRKKHFDLVPEIKAETARVGKGRSLKVLLTSPDHSTYERLIQAISGNYSILDDHGRLVTINI